MKSIAALLILNSTLSTSWACPCHPGKKNGAAALDEFLNLQAQLTAENRIRNISSVESTGMPLLPDETGRIGEPWGGANANRWRAEAVLANATSAALNRAWQETGVRDAIVAVPVSFLTSDYRPYDDGQTNASVSFGNGWEQKRPQVVATLIHYQNRSMKLRLLFDRSLGFGGGNTIVLRFGNSAAQNVELSVSVNAKGDRTADWTPDASLNWKSSTQTSSVFVKPKGWGDWFPISFRHPSLLISQFAQNAPAKTLSDGRRSIVDPERVAASVTGFAPVETLGARGRKFGPGYSLEMPYQVENIHAEYPGPGQGITAVGGGLTWLLKKPDAPFKILYTCFNARNPRAERESKDGGVPSGGGWHKIGIDPKSGMDPVNHPANYGETILNSLEKAPIVVGYGVKSLVNATPSGTFSYGLRDVATVRWLRPGEALVATVGESSADWDGIKPSTVHEVFHWFYFNSSRPVCTEEWVHPCMPTRGNGLGLRCN